jgi:hypothetical protein
LLTRRRHIPGVVNGAALAASYEQVANMFNQKLLALAVLVGTDSSPTPRVRSSHPYIRAMVAEAQVRSATFRRLIAAIDATDGIVYVEEGDCHHHVRACLPPIVTSTGGFRFLRVIVDARQEDWHVMADMAHELQHALEVLKEPTARTDSRLVFLFLGLQAGAGITDVRETPDAVQTGERVKKEVEAFANSRGTKALSRAIPHVGAQRFAGEYASPPLAAPPNR